MSAITGECRIIDVTDGKLNQMVGLQGETVGSMDDGELRDGTMVDAIRQWRPKGSAYCHFAP